MDLPILFTTKRFPSSLQGHLHFKLARRITPEVHDDRIHLVETGTDPSHLLVRRRYLPRR